MKVSAVKYVNARIGAPSVNSMNPFYKSPGEIIEIDDFKIGEEIEGNFLWYHCASDDCYYWSGGLAMTEDLISLPVGRVVSSEESLKIYESAVKELANKFEKSVIGFQGISLGFKETGGVETTSLSLVILVNQKSLATQGAVPKTLKYRGFLLNTDVREIGVASLHFYKDNTIPFGMGGSIAQAFNGRELGWGTRSLMVKWGTSNYLLTCFHVACNSLFQISQYRIGESDIINVNVPSLRSGSDKSYGKCVVEYGRFSISYDFALVKIDQLGQFFNMIPGIGTVQGFYKSGDLTDAYLKRTMFSSFGAESGRIRTGKFKSLHVGEIRFGSIVMTGLIEADNISQAGDSGAPVIDAANRKLIGIIVGGSSTSSFILPFATLNKYFSITL